VSSFSGTRFSDEIRAAVAAYQDCCQQKEQASFVTVKIDNREPFRDERIPPKTLVLVIKRLYTGSNKQLHSDASHDVLVGVDVAEQSSGHVAFAFSDSLRVAVVVSATPPFSGAPAFEGVYQLKTIAVAEIR
jgi:hypothetical protein